MSAESKDKYGGSQGGNFNWTLFEYDPSDGSLDHEFGTQVWNVSTINVDDPVDSQLDISDYTVSAGNRLMLRVSGHLNDDVAFAAINLSL